MTVRICYNCNEQAINARLLDQVIALAKRGAWICPFQKKDCGTVVAAQEQPSQ